MFSWVQFTSSGNLEILQAALCLLLDPLAVLTCQIFHGLDSLHIFLMLVGVALKFKTVGPSALIHGSQHSLLILIESKTDSDAIV